MLYGVDLAKREIARQPQAVVVEGYTDVMACHLSGVETAVATCGTAFGDDHIRVLRRLLTTTTGELPRRGRVHVRRRRGRAARPPCAAFEDDQRFVAQTFVAVEPSGLDPCELRQEHGRRRASATRRARQPLFEFAIRSTLAAATTSTPPRAGSPRCGPPPRSSRAIKDRALRPEYARRLAGWLGMEVEPVLRAVGQAGRAAARSGRNGGGQNGSGPDAARGGAPAGQRARAAARRPGARGREGPARATSRRAQRRPA